MKKLFAILIAAGAFASCNNGQEDASSGTTNTNVSTVDSPAVVTPSIDDSTGVLMDTPGKAADTILTK